MRIFGMSGSKDLAASAAQALGTPLAVHEERVFEDGEQKTRPLVSVRGEDVYVISSLDGAGAASANDKLCQLLFFIATCRDNGAARVTAVIPYLAYARKDRQTKRRDPVGLRTVAQLFEAVGTDRVVCLDVHNRAAFQNAFRCPTVHLDAGALFVPLVRKAAAGLPVAIVAPDGGAIKRAQAFQALYARTTREDAAFCFMEKRRSRDVVGGTLFAGEVRGRAAFILDDMIASGGTMLRAAAACRDHGAGAIHAVATHGPFTAGADALMSSDLFAGIFVTDSVSAARARAMSGQAGRLTVIPVGPTIGAAIGLIDRGEPVSELTGLEE